MTTTISSGLQTQGDIIQPLDSTTWGDLGSTPFGTWAAWTTWHPSPQTITLQIDLDQGESTLRQPLLTLNYQGTVSGTLKITSTAYVDSDGNESGLFAGEETTVTLSEVAAGYVAGRFYRWNLNIDTDSNLTIPLLFSANPRFNNTPIEEIQDSVDTSALSGTIAAREIDTAISVIKNLVVTAQQEGVTYSSGLLQDRVLAVPDDYVFQENAIIVNVVDKATAKIRCFDLNGESIDAIVDIRITGFPQITLTANGVESA